MLDTADPSLLQAPATVLAAKAQVGTAQPVMVLRQGPLVQLASKPVEYSLPRHTLPRITSVYPMQSIPPWELPSVT